MAPSLIRLYACIENNVRRGGPVGGVGVEVFEGFELFERVRGGRWNGVGWSGLVVRAHASCIVGMCAGVGVHASCFVGLGRV